MEACMVRLLYNNKVYTIYLKDMLMMILKLTDEGLTPVETGYFDESGY